MFNTKKQLVTHMFEYHRTDNVGCSQCDKSFSHVSNLMKHEESHGTIMECQHCMKLYKNRYSFKQHVKECSKITELFKCIECEKSFNKSSKLNVI